MRRSARSILAAATAAVVAVATAFVVGSDLAALHRRAASLGPPRPVVVAARDLPLGSVVEPSDLTAATRPESLLPPGAVPGPETAAGRVVAVALVAGAIVQDSHLAAPDRAGLDAVVPPGSRAVRVVTDDGLRPGAGAVVDVLATIDAAFDAGAAGPRTVAVASGAVVLRTDGGDADEYAAAGRVGVTLLVTEQEAHEIAYAQASGVLMLALAPPEAACCRSSER